MKRRPSLVFAGIGVLALGATPARAQRPAPGTVVEIPFSGPHMPPTLHGMMTGTDSTPVLSVRLPADYDPARTYPLVLYLPGLDGHQAGNIGNARTIAGDRDWVVASLPLFKTVVDPGEVNGGILVGFRDAPTISRAYRAMLGRLFELVPNLDPARSGMVGFSNGALTLAVLLSTHDDLVFRHFRSFVLVDQGMFHLTDLYIAGAREARYLILVGDQPDLGRDLKLRGCALAQDAWRLLGVDLTCTVLEGTGHELPPVVMERIGRWLEQASAQGRQTD